MNTDLWNTIISDHLFLSLFAIVVATIAFLVGKMIWEYLYDHIGNPTQKTRCNIFKKSIFEFEQQYPLIESFGNDIYFPATAYFIHFFIKGIAVEYEVDRELYDSFKKGDCIEVKYYVTRVTKEVVIKNVTLV